MKTSDLIKHLTESLAMNGDLPVHSIFNGRADSDPTINVCDDIVYLEGSTAEEKKAQTFKFVISCEYTTTRIVKAYTLEEAQAFIDKGVSNGSIAPYTEDDDPQHDITFYDDNSDYDDDDVDSGCDLTKTENN